MTNSSPQRPQPTPINKTNPGANDRKFIPFPSNALHYIHHERISAGKLFLYAILIDFYNVVEGAAWPSHETLSVMYGHSTKTVGAHLKDLEVAGLLAVTSNKRYLPLEPLEADAFYGRFPVAWENYQRTFQESEKRRASDLSRLAAYRDEMRGTGS